MTRKAVFITLALGELLFFVKAIDCPVCMSWTSLGLAFAGGLVMAVISLPRR